MNLLNFCPACGARGVDGLGGCQAVFDTLTERAFENPAVAGMHNLALDTYCMQHVDRYCKSAKSYAAHLTRLCCGLEYGGDPRIYAAIRAWLDGKVALEKPPVLPQLGSMTIVDVMAADSAEDFRGLARAWAENVWAAYASQHDLARRWIAAAQAAYHR